VDDVKLYLGDCLDILPTLGRVDAVITDPPYGVGFADWDDRKIKGMFSTWLDLMLRVAPVVTFTCGWSKLAEWCVIRKPNAYLYWYKPGAMGFGPFGFTHIDPMPVWGKTKVRGMTDVIYAPIIVEKNAHPTQKPIRWGTETLLRISEPGDLVLDPFMGSGTTGVACVKTGRRFIGIEIDPTYFGIAERRIREAQLQPPLLPNTGIKLTQTEAFRFEDVPPDEP